MRYSRKDAESAFHTLCLVLGRRAATSWNDVGAWQLDWASEYGGYVVQEIMTDSGAVTCPLGDLRRTAREFCESVYFVRRALEVR